MVATFFCMTSKSGVTEYIHKDVGKREPRALCSGLEYDVTCTDEWMHVTCVACFESRHPDAPLSDGEVCAMRRATGPGTSRPVAGVISVGDGRIVETPSPGPPPPDPIRERERALVRAGAVFGGSRLTDRAVDDAIDAIDKTHPRGR